MNLRAAGIRNSVWLWPAVIAALAGAFVLIRLDPAGDHPGGWGGPGMTVDESFNVDQGVRLAGHLARQGILDDQRILRFFIVD